MGTLPLSHQVLTFRYERRSNSTWLTDCMHCLIQLHPQSFNYRWVCVKTLTWKELPRISSPKRKAVNYACLARVFFPFETFKPAPGICGLERITGARTFVSVLSKSRRRKNYLRHDEMKCMMMRVFSETIMHFSPSSLPLYIIFYMWPMDIFVRKKTTFWWGYFSYSQWTN